MHSYQRGKKWSFSSPSGEILNALFKGSEQVHRAQAGFTFKEQVGRESSLSLITFAEWGDGWHGKQWPEQQGPRRPHTWKHALILGLKAPGQLSPVSSLCPPVWATLTPQRYAHCRFSPHKGLLLAWAEEMSVCCWPFFTELAHGQGQNDGWQRHWPLFTPFSWCILQGSLKTGTGPFQSQFRDSRLLLLSLGWVIPSLCAQLPNPQSGDGQTNLSGSCQLGAASLVPAWRTAPSPPLPASPLFLQ